MQESNTPQDLHSNSMKSSSWQASPDNTAVLPLGLVSYTQHVQTQTFCACVSEAAGFAQAQPSPYLLCNALQVRQGEVWLVTILPVVLLELVQVCPQQLTHKEEVLLKAGILHHFWPQYYSLWSLLVFHGIFAQLQTETIEPDTNRKTVIASCDV